MQQSLSFVKTVNSLAAEPLLNSIEKKENRQGLTKDFTWPYDLYLILFFFLNLGCNVQVHLDNKEKRETVMMKA